MGWVGGQRVMGCGPRSLSCSPAQLSYACTPCVAAWLLSHTTLCATLPPCSTHPSLSQGRFFGATIEGMATLASSMRPATAGTPPASDPFAAHEFLGASMAGHSSPLRVPSFRTSSSVGQLPQVPPPWEVEVRKAFPSITRRDIKGTSRDPQLNRSKKRWEVLKAQRDKQMAEAGGVGGAWDVNDYARSRWVD